MQHELNEEGFEVYKLWNVDDVFKLPKPEWLLDTIIPRGGTTLLYGPTNVGKSLVALDWAFRMAASVPWMALETNEIHSDDKHHKEGLRVLYLYAEGGHDLQLRYQAWVEGNKFSRDHITRLRENVRFIGLDEEVNLRWDPDAQQVPASVQKIYNTVADFMPDLIVYDPAQEVWRGIESNSDRHVAMAWFALKEIQRAWGCAALIVHHSRKDDVSFRGATTWLDLADTGFSIEESKSQPGLISLKNTKSRYSEKGNQWTLERRVQRLTHDKLWGEESVHIGGSVRQMMAPGMTEEISEEMRQIEEVLESGNYTVKDLTVAITDKPQDTSLRRTMKLMQDLGYINRPTYGKFVQILKPLPPAVETL